MSNRRWAAKQEKGERSVHGRSTGHDNVAVEILSDIEITLHNRVVGRLVNTRCFETEERRLEESLRSTESVAQGR